MNETFSLQFDPNDNIKKFEYSNSVKLTVILIIVYDKNLFIFHRKSKNWYFRQFRLIHVNVCMQCTYVYCYFLYTIIGKKVHGKNVFVF